MISWQDEAKADPARFRGLDTAFHRRLGEVSANAFLARTALSLNVLGQEFRKTASETPNVIATSIADHRIILAALRRRDADAARLAMATHMSHVLQSTQAAIKAGSDND